MTKKNNFLIILAISLLTGHALASQPVGDQNSVPCGTLEKFAGVVQVLDAGRNRVVDVSRAVPIACGGSISVGSGWAQIKHRDGFKFFLSAGSFIEMPEPNTDGKYSGDHVLLYRGQLYAQLASGAGEFRVLSSNARAKQTQGTMVVIYNREELLTQLITLENKAILENRFQTEAFVTVKAGEASQLNFKLMRVVPADPRAVAIAPLRAKLREFNIAEPDHKAGIMAAKQRLDRKFASSLGESEDDYFKRREANRETASAGSGGEHGSGDNAQSDETIQKRNELKTEIRKRNQDKYDQHVPESNMTEEELHRHWQAHVTGLPETPKNRKDEEALDEKAQELLFPSEMKKKSKSRWLASKKSPEETEKKRLLDELSKLKEN